MDINRILVLFKYNAWNERKAAKLLEETDASNLLKVGFYLMKKGGGRMFFLIMQGFVGGTSRFD